jgi:chromosome segregation ATPase
MLISAKQIKVGLLVATLAGCGGGLKYKVDDGAMDSVPAGDRQGVFEAQKDLEMAKSESRNAKSQLDSLDRDRGIAKTEKEQANLEVDKAQAEVESANASRNENSANAANHSKAAAETGVKAAEQKLTWLDDKQDWLEAVQKAADAHIEAAQAKVEWEKAKVAQAKGIKPDSDFNPSNFEEQWKDKNSDWESAKKKATSEEKDAKNSEAKWKDLVAQQQKMKGG